MPSLLPHDLCHGRSSSRWLPAVIEFQLSYSRSWKMMLWKVLHSIFNMHSICNMPAPGSFLCRGSCHLQIVRALLLLFQFGFLLFLFLLWLLWPKLPKLCWLVVVRVGTLVLFLTLGEMLSIFHIEDNVCCGFVIYSFYYVEVCSFYSYFLEVFFFFIINGCWIFQRFSLHLLR